MGPAQRGWGTRTNQIEARWVERVAKSANGGSTRRSFGGITEILLRPRSTPPSPWPSAGLTDAERNLAKLCRATFLSTWSYPNVQRAEAQRNGGVIAKEVCDLLVVFEEHVVIFSDKDCVFPASGDVDKDWSRSVSE